MTTKKVWGPAVWYMFHTLSYKIKDEHFMEIKDEFLDLCVGICHNLPCPECAEHATDYMRRLNKASIKNRGDLQLFFFNFHNVVNARLKKPIFQPVDFYKKYNSAITKNVVYNFLDVYSKKYHNIKLLTQSFHRDKVTNDFRTFIIKNSHKFNP